MGDKTEIAWTDMTWNPIRGCSRVSPGCENCYAEKMAARFSGPGLPYEGLIRIGKNGARWNGEIMLVHDHLDDPLRKKKPRLIFVNSMSDLFHPKVPFGFIAAVFGVMAAAPQHTFQVLTKRTDRMREFFAQRDIAHQVDTMKHVALAGKIVERFADERVEPVVGWPGYFVTSRGRVLSDRKGPRRELLPMAGEGGHSRVMLYRGDGERSRPLLHRLVLRHFDRPAKNGEQACHIDGDATNNALWNLRWGSQSDNWSDRKRHGKRRSYQKLTEPEVDLIRQRARTGEVAESIARGVNVSATQVRNIVAGRQWRPEFKPEWPLRSVWLGVSVEDQATADVRIPALLHCPAAVRWVSYEPALGPIRFGEIPLDPSRRHLMRGLFNPLVGGGKDTSTPWRIDWIVIGGESGPGARPFDIAWARSTVEQCKAAGIPCFVKQLGTRPAIAIKANSEIIPWELRHPKGGNMAEWPVDLRVREMPVVSS